MSALRAYSGIVQAQVSASQQASLVEFLVSFVERSLEHDRIDVLKPIDYLTIGKSDRALDEFLSPGPKDTYGLLQFDHWLKDLKQLPVEMILERMQDNTQLSRLVGILNNNEDKAQQISDSWTTPTFTGKQLKGVGWLMMIMCQYLYLKKEDEHVKVFQGGTMLAKQDDFALESFRTFLQGNGEAMYDTLSYINGCQAIETVKTNSGKSGLEDSHLIRFNDADKFEVRHSILCCETNVGFEQMDPLKPDIPTKSGI